MDEYEKSLTNSLLTWGFGLILGLLFGLIVFGWWLWPVQWVDASPEHLRYQYQVEYLSTVIEAYGFTGDTATAQARYFALGENAGTALAQIVQNTGSLPPGLVAQFSTQVAGVPLDTLATQPIEEPKTTSGINPWVALLFALLFIFAGAVITYLIFRGRESQESEVEYLEYEPTPADEIAAEPQMGFEEVESFTDLEEPIVEESPAQVELEADEVEEFVPIPIEADEFTPQTLEEDETGGLDLPPFIAVGAGAAIAAGLTADEETEAESVPEDVSEETVPDDEPAEEIAEDQPEETAEEAQAKGAAMAGMAAAVIAEEAEAEEEEPEEEPEEIPPSEEEIEEEIEAPEFSDTEEEEATSEDEEPAEDEVEEDLEADQADEEAVNPYDPIEVKMRKKLTFVEGIGEVYSQKLADVGIQSTGKLMVEGVTRTGRQELAEKTGISETLILKWLNEIDLYRIKGIGSEFADLLEAGGVDTVPELAQRNPDHLYQALANTNEEKHLVRHLPSQDQVKDWVEQAKKLPRIIQY